MPATTLDGLGLATPYREIAYKSAADLEAEFADYAALGVKWIRTDFWWETAQPTPNGYSWGEIDRVVDMAAKYGIEVVAILNGTPQWGHKDLSTASAQQALGQFTKAAAEHFEGRVQYWQIGNEPNHSTKIDPVTYTKMLQLSYDALKEVDSDNFVITAGLASVPSTQGGHTGAVDFLKQMYANGAKGHFDAIGYHPYTYPLLPENTASWNGWQIMQNGIRDTMVANGDANIDIWMTEIGAPTTGGSAAMTQQGQALVLEQVMEFSQDLSWAGPVIWYSYKDRGGATNDTENWFGLVGPNGEKKEAYWTFKELAAIYNNDGGTGEEPPVVVVPEPETPEPTTPTPPVNNNGQTINGTGAADTINAGNGDDVIRAGGSNDTVYGNAGKDTIYGDDGDDAIHGDAGDDILRGGIGADSIRGGSNNDTVYGEDGNDTLWGDDGNDTIHGNAGNDTIRGGDQNDVLYGNDGDDTVFGEGGNDALHGDGGADVLNGGDGDDSVRGGSNNDTINGDNGNDTLWGDDGDDTVHGGAGNDTIRGGDNNDTLNGGAGNDSIYGEWGNDVIYAGKGSDTLSGGDGSDRFIFDNATLTRLDVDTIIDFQKGDIIDLSAIDAKSTQGGNQAFSFIGSNWLSKAGDVGFYQDKGGNITHIQVDVNGDKSYDLDIVLKGLHTLTQGDFVL